MLKLKRVEIQGFKSFYDRTEMKFNGNGIAAVVGPNGCGKSNLSDAISWVLGEQSAKSLRGARMEDVIFAGTRDKKALGMATVTMTLVPDESKLAAVFQAVSPGSDTERISGHGPQDAQNGHANGEEQSQGNGNGNGNGNGAPHAYTPIKAEAQKTAEQRGEITITRRLYRSGESEYLINGKAARLRDIQDLFLGTGLGPESYAIIEQGRIGQILSNKPQDRRNVIEEAAGITKFRTRKRLAEAKLESAKQNLSRVFDILEEVTRQVNSLKRQAAKTRRYTELRAEASGYLRQLLAARFRMLEREAAKAAIELSLVTQSVETVQAAVRDREQSQSGFAEALYAAEKQLTEARKQVADLQLEAERARGRLEYQRKQVQQIDARLAASGQESIELDRQKGEINAELERMNTAMVALEAECTQARQKLDAQAVLRQQAQSRLVEQERGLEAARQKVLKLLGESAGLRNRITQVEAQLAAADRESARAKTEEAQSGADRTRLQQSKAELAERLTLRQSELTSLVDRRRAVEQELQQKRSHLVEARQALDRLRAEHSRMKARRDSLEEVIHHRSYTTETVKRFFTAVERGKAGNLKPAGVLADFLEVDPQYEKATEEFLHDELEYVVVRDWESAELGIDLMRNDLNGRATFLVESPVGNADPADLPRPKDEPGVLTKLTGTLRFTNGLRGLPLHMLPRIGNCYIAADRPLAQRMAAEYPHCWFLSADGVSYHGLAVSGGKKTGAGPLALKRELREVTELERAKQSEAANAQAHLAQLEKDITALNDQLELLRSQQQAHEKDVLGLDHDSRKMAEELQRVQARLSQAKSELERIARDRVRLEENVTRDGEALAQAERGRAEHEQALEQAREDLRGLQSEAARAIEEHATQRASMAALEERQRSLQGERARLESRAREVANRLANLSREGEKLTSERTQLTANNEELIARGETYGAAIEQVEEQTRQLAEQESRLRTQLAAVDEDLRALRAEANAAQEKRSSLQVQLARFESDLEHLEETSRKELESSLAELAEGMETVPDDSALADLEVHYTEARRKIDALGPVNPQAMEEHEEAQQRQDFLSAQRQDLLDSIRDTEKAIGEIDSESHKRFGEAFHAINANFREMFKTLFGGGIGEMRLTDEDNLPESGIDIVASPPGKKLQSVLLLSGGEKSLTAMALLMAVFQYTPSPFCVLDEVDAPLDEPNIERLTRLLRELAQQTQFIVITHSKRTMEAAQSLYGVTMQEPGVSKLVSVKFQGNRASAPAPRSQEPEREVALAGRD
ncbi:MAG: chromosome segregation protein SMC [Bryobacteraceae bacterium]